MSRRVECGDCDWTGTEDDIDLGSVEDLLQRIDPGSEVPAGECPKCGALCYVLRSDNDYNSGERRLLAMMNELIEELGSVHDVHAWPAGDENSHHIGRRPKSCETCRKVKAAKALVESFGLA